MINTILIILIVLMVLLTVAAVGSLIHLISEQDKRIQENKVYCRDIALSSSDKNEETKEIECVYTRKYVDEDKEQSTVFTIHSPSREWRKV